jgi:hypothetical protein
VVPVRCRVLLALEELMLTTIPKLGRHLEARISPSTRRVPVHMGRPGRIPRDHGVLDVLEMVVVVLQARGRPLPEGAHVAAHVCDETDSGDG